MSQAGGGPSQHGSKKRGFNEISNTNRGNDNILFG